MPCTRADRNRSASRRSLRIRSSLVRCGERMSRILSADLAGKPLRSWRSQPLHLGFGSPDRSAGASRLNAFLSAAAARLVLGFPVSLVSTAGPRALPLPARCGTQFASRHRESERRPLLRLRYVIRREPPACSYGEPPKEKCAPGSRGQNESSSFVAANRRRNYCESTS